MKTEELVKKLAQLKKDETRLTWAAMLQQPEEGRLTGLPGGDVVEDAYIQTLGEIREIEIELNKREKIIAR